MVAYRVEPADPRGHRFHVTLRLARPAAQQAFSLPVWAPGSYMVRDFSRHLSGLTARQGRRSVVLVQQDKARWLAACHGSTPLVLHYDVHAFDASVRGAFLDTGRGFFNGSSLLLRAEGREAEAHRLQLARLPRGWQVATAMRSTGRQAFESDDYAELIDHPVALGRFWRGGFQAGGVAHEVAVGGAWPSFDGTRLLADMQRLCAEHIRFWHGKAAQHGLPFTRYVFLLQVAEDGHGGLEHRASSALSAARRDLPRLGSADIRADIRAETRADTRADISDGYAGLLGLISHEYFHAWNVKRLRPAELAAPDLARETHSRLLWFFEGFTSYYDDLLLLRAGLIDRARYLRLLARPINAVAASPGRRLQSVADASFDAWTKHYRPDENSANATVSYYGKGALVALLCDLSLRAQGATLDAVMRALWRRSGAGVGDGVGAGGVIGEDDIAAALAGAGGEPMRGLLQAWVHGTGELPLAPLLAGAGIALRDDALPLAARLGLKLSEGAFSGVQVKQVLRGSAAHAAGLSAGDELLAIDGWRLRRLEDARQWLAPDAAAFELLLVRDQRLLTLPVALPATPAAPAVVLLADDAAGSAALALRRGWLGA